MLDIRFIRDNAQRVAEASAQKGYKVDIEKLLQLDGERRDLLSQAETLRRERNELAEAAKGGRPSDDQIAAGKQLKEELAVLEEKLNSLESDFSILLESIPNIIPEDTPQGGEENNRVEKQWGELNQRDFEVKDHLTLSQERDWIDFERGAKVAGNKFYFLKGDAVQLDLALTQFALNEAVQAGFLPIMVPNMVNSRIASGSGYLPRGEERQIYKIEGEDLNLIATSEMAITGYHADEVLDLTGIPVKYAGYSPCYRMEAGAYGKHARGLYRVHQFNKVELYVFAKPEDSERIHQEMVEFEEALCQKLGLPYQLIRIAAGDLGAPAYKKFDIEYWSPLDGGYRELMSCSNITDYQSRRLGIKYKTENGNEFVHTLNGTAMAMSRGVIAVLENYQQADGSVVIPEALRPFLGGRDRL